MNISGKQLVYVDVEPYEALQELLKEFLGIEQRGSGMHYFKREVKKYNGKQCIIETREVFGNKFEEVVYKELSAKEYKYYLALQTAIEFHKNE